MIKIDVNGVVYDIWHNSPDRKEWLSTNNNKQKHFNALFGCIGFGSIEQQDFMIFATEEDLTLSMLKYPELFEGCEVTNV